MTYYPTVEIPMFILFYCLAVSGPVGTNLMLYRTCYILLGYNKSDCALLGFVNNNLTAALEKEVQPINNRISLTAQLTESLIAVIISLLIGPWSDKFGRRPVFILVTTATLFSNIFGTFFSYFEDISPWFGLIGGIPGMLCGGIFSFITVANSYISERSTDQNRGVRIALFTMSLTLGQILGTFSSSFLLDWLGYTGANGFLTLLIFIAIIYTYFLIPESLDNIRKEGRISGFFDTTNFKEMFFTTTRRRGSYKREIIILFTVISAFCSFIIGGEMPLIFLFLREKFRWSLEHCTIFNGVQNVIGIFGTITGVYLFQNVLQLKESVTTLFCFCMMLTGSLITGLATENWQLYIVPVIRCFDGAVAPFSVTIVSKIVEKHELGKVLAGMMAARFICSFVAYPTYIAIYNATIDTNSAIFNFFSSGLFALGILLLLIIIWLENKRQDITTSKVHLAEETNIEH